MQTTTATCHAIEKDLYTSRSEPEPQWAQDLRTQELGIISERWRRIYLLASKMSTSEKENPEHHIIRLRIRPDGPMEATNDTIRHIGLRALAQQHGGGSPHLRWQWQNSNTDINQQHLIITMRGDAEDQYLKWVIQQLTEAGMTVRDVARTRPIYTHAEGHYGSLRQDLIDRASKAMQDMRAHPALQGTAARCRPPRFWPTSNIDSMLSDFNRWDVNNVRDRSQLKQTLMRMPQLPARSRKLATATVAIYTSDSLGAARR